MMGRLRLVMPLLLLALPATVSARTWYIEPGGSGDAPTIQAGIDSSVAGDTVLVACGVYFEHDIVMKSGICLRSETGHADCATIDAQGQSRVMYCAGIDSATRIEGLTITGGVARGDPPDNHGGGLYGMRSSPGLSNCIFEGNAAGGTGGAMNWHDHSSPVVTNCVFLGNSSHHAGAAYFQWLSSPTFIDCGFSGNSADWGGAITLSVGSCTFTNCTFSDNAATWGGGILCDNATVVLTNCTFFGNRAHYIFGAGINCSWSQVTVRNTIIAFSTASRPVACHDSEVRFSYCDVYGNAGGDWVGCIADQYGIYGNFSECPSFCHADADNFYLCDESPCAPGNHPHGYDCGLIGAWEVGCSCGPSAAQPITWGSIKAMYR